MSMFEMGLTRSLGSLECESWSSHIVFRLRDSLLPWTPTNILTCQASVKNHCSRPTKHHTPKPTRVQRVHTTITPVLPTFQNVPKKLKLFTAVPEGVSYAEVKKNEQKLTSVVLRTTKEYLETSPFNILL